MEKLSKEEDLKLAQEHISYERLLTIARKMHLWIFLHSGDDNYEYEKMGITDAENAILGSIYVVSGDDNDKTER